MHLTILPRHPRRLGAPGNRAVAAVEFALIAPMVTIFLAAACDYGAAVWNKGYLTNAVAQGAYYASRNATTVTAAGVKTLVTDASVLKGITATVTDPALCYCPVYSTVPATLGSAVSCNATSTNFCSDPNVSTNKLAPGNYITITANYTLTSIFPMKGLSLLGHQISDTVTVRLQ